VNSGETRAWDALRSLRGNGFHVVRQHKIGRYTVDFAIRSARVAIEIDGAVHDFPGRAEYDSLRQKHLEEKGWRVVRLRSEATHDASAIIEAVLAAFPLPLRGGGRGWGEAPPSGDQTSSISDSAIPSNGSASPHPPTPSPQGEGEFPRHLERRTRANRVLRPRRKP